jgi:hypothetical protein
MKTTWFSICWIFMALLPAAHCRSFQVTPPQGFAVYESESPIFVNEYRAITADGVRYRVRVVKNEPEGDATLWKQTLIKGLEKKGYRILSSDSLKTDQGRTVQYVNSQLSAGGMDFLYLTGFIVDGRRIIIVEAGGTKELMSMHEKALQNSIRSLRL